MPSTPLRKIYLMHRPRVSLPCSTELYKNKLTNVPVGLLDHEKADMLRELEEHNSDELAKLRGEWNNLSQNIHHLEAEVEASQTLVREVCAEREDLRKMLENKQNEISAEDQEVMTEMQMLLGEFETHNSEGGETPQKSSFELLKQCAGVLEKNVERLAQRAEVSLTCFPLVFMEYLLMFLNTVYPTTKRAHQILA